MDVVVVLQKEWTEAVANNVRAARATDMDHQAPTGVAEQPLHGGGPNWRRSQQEVDVLQLRHAGRIHGWSVAQVRVDACVLGGWMERGGAMR